MLITNIQEEIIEEVKIDKKKYILDIEDIYIPVYYLNFRYFLEKLILIAFSPIWISILILTYISIKIAYGGKCLFKQERPGKNNSTFFIYKFKSMKDIDLKNETTVHQEERITALGKFIRKHRLDELPQFINVLKGEMSLIGPRPDALNCHLEWKEHIPQYDFKYIIKPGITGYGQVYYKHVSDIEEVFEKFKYDIYYLKNISFSNDIKIFFKTIIVMITGFGSR